MSDLADLIRSERHALLDFLKTLSAQDWANPSLCGGWSVQDVAAHLASAPVGRPQEILVAAVRSRLNPNRMIADEAVLWPGGVRRRSSSSCGAPPRRASCRSACRSRGLRDRSGGLRLVADDLDWRHGDGPEVRGSGEALVLAMAGRPVGSDELTGRGASALLSRLPMGAVSWAA